MGRLGEPGKLGDAARAQGEPSPDLRQRTEGGKANRSSSDGSVNEGGYGRETDRE